jgi:hypothetical protein
MQTRAYDLTALSRQFAHRIGRLVPLVKSAQSPANNVLDRATAYVAIELLNSWANFCRAFYISSALHAWTASGTRVTTSTPRIVNVPDATDFAMYTLKPRTPRPWTRRQEPTWHSSAQLIKLLMALGASNLATVTAALSYPTDAFGYLPTARNFFAHRNEDTARKLHNIAAPMLISAIGHPTNILIQKRPARPNNVLTDWALDLLVVSGLMVR